MSEGLARKRQGTDERREKIIHVTLDLAARQGVDKVTTRGIAQAMGVTQNAVFRHFLSKDAIWLAVMQWVREHLMSGLGRAAEQGHDPLDALQRMFFAHIAFITAHPVIPRILTSEQLHGRSTVLRRLVAETMLDYETKIATLLADARTQRQARADLDVHAAATLYLGMIQGLVLQASILRGQRTLVARTLATEAARAFPVFLEALRPPASTTQGAIP
ncbi:MAG: TetR family transcriptional regulator [Thiobacillus sp. SCN 63-374]|nr:MAG: TetR family transcriptional regulator [Thiobacillus sp. SCN 63-374]